MGGTEDLRDLLASWEHEGSPLSRQVIRRGLGELRLCRGDISDRVVFSEAAYQRILIYRGMCFEVLLLCWRSGQVSPIHDHSGSVCGVRVIEGAATETSFAPSRCGRLVPARSRCHGAGSVSVSYDADVHQMGNLAPPGNDLITLHIYSPPLTAMRIYSIDETTLADHDQLAGRRPRVLTRQIRMDGRHVGPSNTPRRARKVAS